MTKIFKKLIFNKKVIKKYMKKLVNWIKMTYILKKNIFLYQTKIKIKQQSIIQKTCSNETKSGKLFKFWIFVWIGFHVLVFFLCLV